MTKSILAYQGRNTAATAVEQCGFEAGCNGMLEGGVRLRRQGLKGFFFRIFGFYIFMIYNLVVHLISYILVVAVLGMGVSETPVLVLRIIVVFVGLVINLLWSFGGL
ncbi:hypothetical protein BDQ17DRAFT_1407115 [Cyathus striatus]|nr:hypothetical protein BDQ17DRAFT_1407115 [Cyathus striatus]